MNKGRFYWRKLDNQAKVFSLAASKEYSSVFRLSVVLKEKIEVETLEKAVKDVFGKYKAFKVRMKRGFFWYYFEENTKEPVITLENTYPFEKVNTKDNNKYLFKVTYYENKINIEFFHTLTDGNGGIDFLKEITYKYLELKHQPKSTENMKATENIIQNSEDSYVKNYKRQAKVLRTSKKAYMLQGQKLEKGNIAINHFIINTEELKPKVRSNETTISIYLTAILMYSIYEASYKRNNGKKPVKMCIPINLKKYFTSDTISNFFTYMTIDADFKEDVLYSFSDILKTVKEEFKSKLTRDEILKTMSANVKLTNNPIIRIIPLRLKEIIVKLFSKEVKRRFTMTFSNIGKIEISENYKEYIEEFIVMIAPDWAEKMKCAVCSFDNKTVFTFATTLKESGIENKFKDFLTQNNIKFKIEGNEVNDTISKS